MFEKMDLLRLLADRGRAPYVLDRDQRAAVREGLAQLRKGELASQVSVDATLGQPWPRGAMTASV